MSLMDPLTWPNHLIRKQMREGMKEALEQRWCPGPVHVEGHLVQCTLGEGHTGDCVPSAYWRHRHDCDRNGCNL